MKVRLFDIPAEGLSIVAKADDRWFGNLIQVAFQEDYRKGSPASLELYLLNTCENISITGTAEIDLSPSCDRCLETFAQHLTIPLQVNLAPAPDIDRDEDGASATPEEDINFSFYHGDEFDLGAIVREMILLEVPIKYLCTDTCKGLCPRCGQNLNLATCSCTPHPADPRLAVLKKLLKG